MIFTSGLAPPLPLTPLTGADFESPALAILRQTDQAHTKNSESANRFIVASHAFAVHVILKFQFPKTERFVVTDAVWFYDR